jgi:hypothetical protein
MTKEPFREANQQHRAHVEGVNPLCGSKVSRNPSPMKDTKYDIYNLNEESGDE